MPRDSHPISFPRDAADKIRGILFNEPRELSGRVLRALEKTLETHEGSDSARLIENWYKSADVVSYDNTEAAAAYLGAYGSRSILKYQEAVFSLLVNKSSIRRQIDIIDYGAGPCVGFAALIDLWQLLSGTTSETLKLNYIAVDRSRQMLEVGKTFGAELRELYKEVPTSFMTIDESEIHGTAADLLIMSNVLNEGEGNLVAADVLESVASSVDGLRDIVIIEPATEFSYRQMCKIGLKLTGSHHLGPCPSMHNNCDQWTFREFRKRIYNFERRCCGTIVGAARDCKYSLSLISFESEAPELKTDENIVIKHSGASGRTMICRYGEKSWVRSNRVKPWDVISTGGILRRSFP